MRNDSALKVRVTRLASGDVRAEDLMRIFLAVRDRTFGIESVREVGDFIAHSQERCKGVATQVAKDFFLMARFHLPRLGQIPVDLLVAPANICEVIKASLRRINPDVLKDKTGHNRNQAEKVIRDVLKRFQPNPDGTMRLTGTLTQRESLILAILVNALSVGPAFTGSELASDLQTVLLKNKLLNPEDAAGFEKIAGRLAVYAASQMHLCRLILEDGSLADCYLGISDTGAIHVMAEALCPSLAGGNVLVAFSIFQTTEQGVDYCDPNDLPAPPNAMRWMIPLELSSDWKLCALR